MLVLNYFHILSITIVYTQHRAQEYENLILFIFRYVRLMFTFLVVSTVLIFIIDFNGLILTIKKGQPWRMGFHLESMKADKFSQNPIDGKYLKLIIQCQRTCQNAAKLYHCNSASQETLERLRTTFFTSANIKIACVTS